MTSLEFFELEIIKTRKDYKLPIEGLAGKLLNDDFITCETYRFLWKNQDRIRFIAGMKKYSIKYKLGYSADKFLIWFSKPANKKYIKPKSKKSKICSSWNI